MEGGGKSRRQSNFMKFRRNIGTFLTYGLTLQNRSVVEWIERLLLKR